jgi:hypothetical protein
MGSGSSGSTTSGTAGGGQQGGSGTASSGQQPGSGSSGTAGATQQQGSGSGTAEGNQRQGSSGTAQGTQQGGSTSGSTQQSGTSSSTSTTGSIPTLQGEQRTQVVRSFSSVNVTPVTEVNFSVSTGTVIPQTVELREVPADVIQVVPAYRGYRFFVVRNQIVIVEPGSRKIVTVIERTS